MLSYRAIVTFISILAFVLICLGCSKPDEPEVHQTAAVVFDPPSGFYELQQNVSLTCTTPDARIYYSTDGTEPTESSTLYQAPLTVEINTSLKARAYKSGYTPSPIAEGIYTIREVVAAPSMNPAPGTYTTAQWVSMSCDTQDAIIRYTTDSSEPTVSSQTYTEPLWISNPTIFKVKAFKDGYTPSPNMEFSYLFADIPVLETVSVATGTYTMGDTRGEGYNDNELPTHHVTQTGFLIGKYEVTQKQYAFIIGSIPGSEYGVGDNFPVYDVNWYAAIKFCNLYSLHKGLNPVYSISGITNPDKWGAVPTVSDPTWNSVVCDWTANGYRLPTEAEWEFAARGGTANPDYTYSGSSQVGTVAWCMSSGGDVAKEVGTKAPNGLGIYDMSGNLYEWCWNWFGNYGAGAATNPRGPLSGTERMRRGGYYSSFYPNCRVSARNLGNPGFVAQGVGFRMCRNLP